MPEVKELSYFEFVDQDGNPICPQMLRGDDGKPICCAGPSQIETKAGELDREQLALFIQRVTFIEECGSSCIFYNDLKSAEEKYKPTT